MAMQAWKLGPALAGGNTVVMKASVHWAYIIQATASQCTSLFPAMLCTALLLCQTHGSFELRSDKICQRRRTSSLCGQACLVLCLPTWCYVCCAAGCRADTTERTVHRRAHREGGLPSWRHQYLVRRWACCRGRSGWTPSCGQGMLVLRICE